MLAAAEIEFENISLSEHEEFKALKDQDELAFGQLPVRRRLRVLGAARAPNALRLWLGRPLGRAKITPCFGASL